MRLKHGASLASLFILSAACTTPGLEYTARLMPENFAATEHRDVAVEPFAGPAGVWYAGQFEVMLLQTEFDAAPWFTVISSASDISAPAPSGLYSGHIQIVDYAWDERHRSVSKCIEWDGLFDCETRVDVEEICFSEAVEVAVEPRLISIATGEIVFSGQYSGRAEDQDCFETGVYDGIYNKRLKRKRRRHTLAYSGPALGLPGVSAPAHLVREALRDTLRPIRKDIAPRNARIKARFMTHALDTEVRADLRFEQALALSKDDPQSACALWAAMIQDYDSAPAVLYNHGVCAEADHKFAAAQALYAQASGLMLQYGEAGKSAHDMTVKSLRKLSDQRYGLEAIEALTGERLAAPGEGTS